MILLCMKHSPEIRKMNVENTGLYYSQCDVCKYQGFFENQSCLPIKPSEYCNDPNSVSFINWEEKK